MAGSIIVAGLANSRKTPGIFLSVIMGGPGTSAGASPYKVLLLGNKITSAIVLASPAATAIAAGTQADATPVAVYNGDDAATYFGRGSELHRMTMRVFEQYPDATLHACSIAESAGARGDVILTFVNDATAAYTVRFRLCEKTIDVAVSLTTPNQTPTQIAAACADAILDEPDLPMTAQNLLGGLTLTAKNTGPRGNDLIIDAAFVNSAGVETRITTAGATSPGATTGTLSGGAAEGGEYRFAGGLTADSNTLALAAIEPTKYHRIVSAQRDTVAVDALMAQVNAQAGVTTQIRQQAIVCYPDGLGSASAQAIQFAQGRNGARLQIVWHYNTRVPPPEVAAQETAARLIGDSIAGGLHIGEASSPSANLDGTELITILRQTVEADRPTATEIESALNNGLTVLAPSANRPGYANIVRSITSRSLASSQPNYAVLDTAVPTVLDYVADDLQSDLGTTFASFRLAADSTDGSPPTAPLVTTPSGIRNRIAYKLGLYEEEAIIRDVAANMSLLAVVENGSSPGRADAEIPVEPMTGLHIVGGNVRQVS